MCLQHLLIVVKVILAVVIPDEPDWIRKKREHIEYTSMQALREQVNHHAFTYVAFLALWFFFASVTTSLSLLSRSCTLKSPDCVSKCWGGALCSPVLSCCNQKIPTSVLCGPRTGEQPGLSVRAHNALLLCPRCSTCRSVSAALTNHHGASAMYAL